MKQVSALGRVLDDIFLRLYAKNLSRKYRGDAANACADTEIQMSTLLLLSFSACLLILGALFAPALLRRIINGGEKSIGLLVVGTVLVAYAVHRRFRGYEFTPELTQNFQTPQHRRWAIIIFWSGALGWLVIAVITLARPH